MEVLQFIAIALLIVLVAEVTYVASKTSEQRMPGRRQNREILLDTSVLIDGRIMAVARSGFMGGILVIPRSVIGELQFLADTADHEKRARARSGLDVVAELQALGEIEVEILQDGSKATEGVDERLLSLAKKRGAAICTLDYNLNKVALVENIVVLNINELAQTLRMAYLPGEKMRIELVQKGQDAHQGVGYLPDGTMVVVERASQLIGQTVEVEIIRSLQTAAGRMMFARQMGGNDAATASRGRQAVKTNAAPAGKKPVRRQPSYKKPKPERVDHESNLINLIKNS